MIADSSQDAVPGLAPGSRIFVAGHRGLVGSALVRRFTADGHEVVTRGRERLDLRDAGRTARFLAGARPDAVVLAAARVGGIAANDASPVEFLEDNLRIQLSVISGAHAARVPRLVFSSTAAVYGNPTELPIPETAVKAPTNTYGATKLAVDMALTAWRNAPSGARWQRRSSVTGTPAVQG